MHPNQWFVSFEDRTWSLYNPSAPVTLWIWEALPSMISSSIRILRGEWKDCQCYVRLDHVCDASRRAPFDGRYSDILRSVRWLSCILCRLLNILYHVHYLIVSGVQNILVACPWFLVRSSISVCSDSSEQHPAMAVNCKEYFAVPSIRFIKLLQRAERPLCGFSVVSPMDLI